MGRAAGREAGELGATGWYAPATNMHRSPFNGRNYEYYSEDSYLSGMMCGSTVAGAKESGVYSFVKHMICNDGESGIFRDSVYIWMTEQALREIYLEPFRMLVEEFDATAIMSSYNRIGAVWTGGSKASKNIIYMYLNALVSNQEYAKSMNDDSLLKPIITTGTNIWRGLIVAVDVVAMALFALALWNLLKYRKCHKAQNN